MAAALTALLTALGLVFVAELGDKSMLLALVMGPRYGAGRVLTAIALETAIVMALAVLLGGVADLLLPERALALGSGLLFVGFGVWTLRGNDGDEEAVDAAGDRSLLAVIAALAVVFFLSELGDKTQVATLSLSSLNPHARLGVWVGATVGMVAADAVAIGAGQSLMRLISRRTLKRSAGVLFIFFGAGAIAIAVW